VSRRVHIDHLRQLDPVVLNITVQDAVRSPVTQLSGPTIAAMIAFADADFLPKALKGQFQDFANRVPRELADLPHGGPMEEILAELDKLEPEFVPAVLRTAAVKQAEQRPAYRSRWEALTEKWSAVEPTPITPVAPQMVVHRVHKTASPEEPKRRAASAAPRGSGSSTSAAAPKVPRAAPVKFVDQDRHKWLSEQALERLSEYLEQGLREDVLVTGLRHRARAQYPDLTPLEIVGVLKELANSGRVRVSAGRWKRVIGRW